MIAVSASSQSGSESIISPSMSNSTACEDHTLKYFASG